jgi:hypothetical protein
MIAKDENDFFRNKTYIENIAVCEACPANARGNRPYNWGVGNSFLVIFSSQNIITL